MGFNPKNVLGVHVIADLKGCNVDKIKFVDRLEPLIISTTKDSGATVLSYDFHQFEPFGVTGVVLIAESHFSIHTWPEEEYAGLDFFTCGESMNPRATIDELVEALEANEVEIQTLKRGS